MRIRLPAVAVVCALALVACTSGRQPAPESTTTRPPAATTAPRPVDPEEQVDRSTRRDAQKLLDEAVARLTDDGSARFATYVNFGGSAVKTTGSFDLGDGELESLTSFSPTSATARPQGVRSRVVGGQIYGGPDFGPFKKCWFHYVTGALDEMLPGDVPFVEEQASLPAALLVVLDATAVGSLKDDEFQVRSTVSAQSALAALSPKLTQKVFDKLPKKDLSTRATVTIQNGRYAGLAIHGDDVLRTYRRGGVDLFDGDVRAEKSFRSATLYASFADFGATVAPDVPPADSIIEFAGVDDVDSSGTACAAAAS